jgi:hypothetical protein
MVFGLGFPFRALIPHRSVFQSATIVGRVYYDNNKNDKFDIGSDVPIANTVIVLVAPVKKRAQDVLGRTRTDSQGSFVMTFDRQSPGITLNVIKVGVVSSGVGNNSL